MRSDLFRSKKRFHLLFGRFAFICAAAFLGSAALPRVHALEVDRAELESSRNSSIVFISYEGPHARIESREDIRGIGVALGTAIRAGAVRAGSADRYFAVHSVAQPANSKLDADIVGLGVDAGVDHIRNLRLILQGYLEAAYGYTAADAALLAEFTTVYNAVRRGDWEYFASRYKDGVLSGLQKEKAGLSVRFDEWPGRALIVIPLGEARPGSLSAIDTSPLTEKKVIDELRKDDSKGVEVRRDMVDLKEREADAAKQTADLKREAIADEEAKIAAEKTALAAEKDRIAAEEEKASAAKATAAAGPGTAGKAETGTDAGAAGTAKSEAAAPSSVPDTTAAKTAVAEKEAEIAKREAAVQEARAEASESEALAAKKTAEAKAERTDIAKDQQASIAAETAAAADQRIKGIAALRMVAPDSPLARLVLVDPATGRELKASVLDTIRSRAVAFFADRIIAVAGSASGTGAVRLVSLDPVTLEMTGQGENDVYAESPLWASGEDLFALVPSGSTLAFARFDLQLARKAISPMGVHPFASPTFAEGAVAIQGIDGAVLILNAGDLVAPKK
ncbi:MAG: hypothetical protein A2Z99_17710 [Treponema sp. GWB1_62_6]|nr:MAG: hypothetical protein A2001_17340 [Treponema sp. GWC1_61_84]OHE71868.1 MAG: hypothetical protein A2Z99_17710 [Treponema sp. GWB1_62_6]HCM26813.1 hypothetical protein [Treponema sp.]